MHGYHITLFPPFNTEFKSKGAIIIFAIPNTMRLYSYLFNYFLYIPLVYQMIYLYLICYYLKSKIRAIDRQVIQSIQLSRYQNLRQIIQNYYQIYSEINEYNTTFWSKYLFVFWLTFGSLIVLSSKVNYLSGVTHIFHSDYAARIYFIW